MKRGVIGAADAGGNATAQRNAPGYNKSEATLHARQSRIAPILLLQGSSLALPEVFVLLLVLPCSNTFSNQNTVPPVPRATQSCLAPSVGPKPSTTRSSKATLSTTTMARFCCTSTATWCTKSLRLKLSKV